MKKVTVYLEDYLLSAASFLGEDLRVVVQTGALSIEDGDERVAFFQDRSWKWFKIRQLSEGEK